MRKAAVIPARMSSSRFPGKPLTKILGLPMVEHVRRRIEKAGVFDEVIVATCDQEIKDVVEKSGGRVIMTSDKHRGATDRVEEAAHHIDCDVIANIQGDEPMVSKELLECLVAPFESNAQVPCSCLVFPIEDLKLLPDLNVVKAVLSRTGRIIYLSRSIIPGKEIDESFKYYKQSGFMAFRKDFLHQYQKMPMTPLEVKESVDMLRILENDLWIQGVISNDETLGVDIPEHVPLLEHAIMSNPHQKHLFESIL